MLFYVRKGNRREPMRTTVSLDEEQLAIAQSYTGMTEKSALIREALKALIERESARRLALPGGSQPQLKDVPWRRSEIATKRRMA